MSREDMIKIAEDHKANHNKNINKESVKEMTTNKEEKKLTKVLDISREYVKEFFLTASKEDQEWIIGKMAELQTEKGDVKYFAAFRSEFAKRFFPELFSKKAGKKKQSLLDELVQLQKK